MNKEIYFCVDTKTLDNQYIKTAKNCGILCVYCKGYRETESAIKLDFDDIIIFTTSMANFSFDLIEKGYDIYLCHDNRQIKIEPHMDLTGKGKPCKDLRFGNNILKLFLAGVFNELLYD